LTRHYSVKKFNANIYIIWSHCEEATTKEANPTDGRNVDAVNAGALTQPSNAIEVITAVLIDIRTSGIPALLDTWQANYKCQKIFSVKMFIRKQRNLQKSNGTRKA
jgi:membrane-bound inhibitor of C-type lysozyme